MSKSSIYKLLSDDELAGICRRHLGEVQRSASVLTGGLFNTTYLLEMQNGTRYVLRVGPVNRHLIMPFEQQLMAAEEWFCRLCAEKQVPMSTIVVCDTSREIVDRDYMIVEYIESAVLSSFPKEYESRNKLYNRVGYYASLIHSVKGEQFGRLSDIIMGKGESTWGGYIRREIEEAFVMHRTVNRFTDSQLADIEMVFNRHMPMLNRIETPQLIHADLWEGNVLVHNDEVAAVIDGDRALFGDMEFEMASGWMINDAFIEGYGRAPATDTDSITRRKLYSLQFSLLDTYFCFGEYNNVEGSDANRDSTLKTLSEFV